jgi:hypothetical protein
MNEPIRLDARFRDSFVYAMRLRGETRLGGWGMQVERERLLEAVEAVAGDAPAGRRGRGAAPTVILTVCEVGLSVRGGAARRDLPGVGIWASPTIVSAARLKAMAGKLREPDVRLEYDEGRLFADWRTSKAREL